MPSNTPEESQSVNFAERHSVDCREMAARLEAAALVELQDFQTLERPSGGGVGLKKGGRVSRERSQQENREPPSPIRLPFASLQQSMDFNVASLTTFPTLTSEPAATPTSRETPSLHQQPSTGQLEPRVVRRTRLADLLSSLRNATGLNDILKSHLLEADRLICSGKTAEAIPCLEEAIINAKNNSRLQCILWRILGNAHLSLGHHKKASVCHMHQLAFCRELDDFTGITMAECNLGKYGMHPIQST